METVIQATSLKSNIVANIILRGDISGLSQSDKLDYYRSVCERIGVDPATQPFQLLKLQGKEVLYCTKSGAEQLTKIHSISHEIKDRQTVSDVFVVYVRAHEKGGRYVDSSGAVSIVGLKGDALANALMKAETKAKRRATLSLLGLGMLDETETEIISGAEKVELPQEKKVEQKEEPPSTPNSQPPKTNGRLPHDEDVCPIGRYSKGKMFKDISEKNLQSAIDWAKENEPEKFKEFISHGEEYLAQRKNGGMAIQ